MAQKAPRLIRMTSLLAHDEVSTYFEPFVLSWILRVEVFLGKFARLFRSDEARLFLFVATIYAFTILPFSSSNERSRFALTRAIVFDQSLRINRYASFVGIDVSRFEGNSYSSMAPGVSILLIPFFIIGTLFGGLLDPYLKSFGVTNIATPSQVVMVQLFSGFCSALSTVYVYRLSLALGSRRSSAIVTGLIYAFATPVWVFGKTLFGHTFSALFLVMTYYYVILFSKRPSLNHALFTGIFSGIALLIEYTNALLLIPGMVYLLIKSRMNVKCVVVVLRPLIASGLLLLFYNCLCFKNPLTFPETYWIGYEGNPVNPLSKFSTPLDIGLKGLLTSSSRGLLVFSPIAVLTIPSFYLLGKSKRQEAIILGSVFLINLFTYAKWYMWNGGGSYGPRFLVPSLPLLFIPFFALIDRLISTRFPPTKLLGSVGLTAFFLTSTSIVSIGAITSPVAEFTYASFLDFLNTATGFPNISKGTLRDLLYVMVYDRFRSLGVIPSAIGQAFWICLIIIPNLSFASLLVKYLVKPINQMVENRLDNHKPSLFTSLKNTIKSFEIYFDVKDSLKSRKIDLLILLSFWIVAFLLRFWNYATIPTPRSDELGEDNLALGILQGYYPLTNNAKFTGSFYQYILAGFYLIFGKNSSTARLMSVFFGAFTIIITYLLAKDLYDRKTALISATLLTTSVAHILIASHVGWSASLTPFFGTFTLYLINRALVKEKKLFFFAAGLTSGITLQTHPVSIFLLVGLGIFTITYCQKRPFMIKRKRLFILLISAGFTLGYVNMIYFNLVNPLASLTYAQNAKWTGLSSMTWNTYVTRFQSLSAEYLRMMGEYLAMTENFTILLSNSKVLLYLALIFISIIYSLKKHDNADRMLLLILGSAWCILPIAVKGYGFPNPWGGHYVSLLLPISYILISMPLSRLLVRFRAKNKMEMITLILVLSFCFYTVATSCLNLAGFYRWPK